MNNLRKSTVLLLVGVFVISMLMVPFAPNANVASPVSQTPDQDRDFIQQWADRVENEMVGEKMDPLLVSYMDTGVIDTSISTKADGSVKLLLYLDAGFSNNLLYSIADVNWQMDFVVSRVASVSVNSIAALKQIEATDGIRYVQADRFIDRTVNSAPGTETDMFHIDDVVGATAAKGLGYDGTGAIVAIDDTGSDLSHPDLIGVEYNNGTYPMSYDPSSVGLTQMYVANGSVVDNTTAWLEAGNLLTYNGTDGNMYVNVTGWDPIINYAGGRYGLSAYEYLIGDMVDFFASVWGIDNATEYIMSEIWMDWQIPDPVGVANYTFGWAFQQPNDGGVGWIYAPSMIYNHSLVIDWNGAYAFTNWYMDTIWNEVADMTVLADRAYYADMMDWSFRDDIAAGYVFNKDNNILTADLDDDGYMDIGIGSLSWAYDDLGYLAKDYGVFFGITPDGMAWNALFNHDSNHGMWTSSAIAGQGVLDYEVYDNTTTWEETTVVNGKTVITERTETSLYKLPGVANGSKLIICKGITNGGSLMADFWGAGFDLNSSAGPYGNLTYWEYTPDGREHHADIVSNSWGWGPGGSYLQLYEYALMYDLASADGVLDPDYHGTLFIFSAGNNGNDYGTTGTPGGSYSVVSVGASYTSHYYEGLYGPDQTDGQQVYFSATGPAFTGYVKPDVMAPGYRGVSPEPFANIWLDKGESYYWWQGTSLSCPVAAGVAAIIIDAYMAAHTGNKPSPQVLKNILLSTATDIGIDPFAQGHGVVNALAAVQAIENTPTDQYYFQSDSFKLYSDQVLEAWDAYAYDDDPFGIYMNSPTPVGIETSSIFFGSVSRGDTVHVNLSAWDFTGTAVDTTPFDSVTDRMMTEDQVVKFQLTSSFYNDTNFDPYIVRPTTFDLEAAMDAATSGFAADFNAATYATIQVSFDAANIGTVVRLFDWDDTDSNGYLNYWNFDHYVNDGDIVDHVSRATDPCNLLTMRVGSPTTLATLFNDGVAALQLDAPKAGIVVDVTITLWQLVDDPAILVSDGTTDLDVQLIVPGDAEYGVHQGQIILTDGAWTHKVPYSYMVDFDMDGANYGGEQTLVNGIGATHTPYDTGATTTAFIEGTTRTDESGGIDVFRVNIPYDIDVNASIVVIRAEWMNAGTVIDFQVRNLLNGVEAATATLDPQEPTRNTIIWDYEGLVNGSWWFLVYTRAFNGTSVPEPISITFQLYNATTFAAATYDNRWVSASMMTPTLYFNQSVLTGDHVVINNNWTVPAVAGVPEYVITDTKIALLSGLYVSIDGVYVDPGTVDTWQGLPLTSPAYKWETVEGITAGDNVRVAIDAQSGQDPAFDVWAWNDANHNGIVDDYDNELGATALLNKDDGGGGTPESGSFTAAENMNLAIRVYAFAYAYVPGAEFTLTVDTRASVDIWNGVDVEYAQFDTYELRRNITMTVQYTCYTGTDVVFFDELGTVTFNNYFAPVVTVNVPVSLGSDVWNLTWSSTDQNAGDTPYYSLWLSRDAGVTFVLLQQNITATNYTWDSSSWLESNYIVRVRAYSCDFTNWTLLGYTDGVLCDVTDPPAGYWPGDFSDGFSSSFAAGAIPPVTTTTTTTTPTPTNATTTTTTTPSGGVVLDPLLIGLLGGIGVGVVVLLILFLVRKK